MAESPVDEILQRNKRFATTHRPYKFFAEGQGSKRPSILIITCLDPRCNPEEFFSLLPGDAAIIRVGGGRVAPLIAQIISLDCFLGSLKEIMVIHHTDCGATHMTEKRIHDHVLKEDGVSIEDATQLVLPFITDLEQSVRDDVKLLKASKIIRRELRENASGYLYDVKSGLVRRV
ncbi:carbonic anhydrase [Trichoderma sp. SZMC 28011]